MRPSPVRSIDPLESQLARQIRVLVVDDHQIFRSGLVAGLESDADIQVAGQASHGPLGVKLAAELRPDVTLLDLEMPGLGRIDAIEEILAGDESARVIVLTAKASKQDVADVVRAGARGYLLKEATVAEIISAVRAVHSGDCWTSPAVTRHLFDQIRSRRATSTRASGLSTRLSERELEVLRGVARGLSNAEIAAELRISPRTAKNHLAHVLAKLELSNRAQAAAYAVRQGLD